MQLQLLLVSSSPFEREALASLIKQAGHSVDSALTSQQMLRLYESNQYDAAIIDVDFESQKQGWLLAKQLRIGYQDRNLTIILLIRNDSKDVQYNHDFDEICDWAIIFPISPEAFVNLIERAIKVRNDRLSSS